MDCQVRGRRGEPTPTHDGLASSALAEDEPDSENSPSGKKKKILPMIHQVYTGGSAMPSRSRLSQIKAASSDQIRQSTEMQRFQGDPSRNRTYHMIISTNERREGVVSANHALNVLGLLRVRLIVAEEEAGRVRLVQTRDVVQSGTRPGYGHRVTVEAIPVRRIHVSG